MYNKYISVLVYGRTSGNDGFFPLTESNGPKYILGDDPFSGVNSCAHFYVVKIDEDFTIYQYVRNEVYPSVGERPSSLNITFSVPRNHRFIGGYSPYEILMNLWEHLSKEYLKCLDPNKGIYEFSKPKIEDGFFNDVIKNYPLEECASPHRPMTPNIRRGCLRLTEDRISDFLKDVQYPDFKRCRELVISSSFTDTDSYEVFNNLKIPREPSYVVYVDDVYCDTVTDRNRLLSYKKGGYDEKYYECESVEFTIGHLIARDSNTDPTFTVSGIPNKSVVKFDGGNETVRVTTPEPKPIKKEYRVSIVNNDIADAVKRHCTLKLKVGGKYVNLAKDWSFVLRGEENKSLESGNIKAEFDNPNYIPYELNGIRIENGIVKLIVKKKPEKTSNSSTWQGHSRSQSTEVAKPILDSIIYKLDFSICKAIESGETLKVEVKGGRGDITYRLVQPIEVPKDKRCELSISKSWTGLDVDIIIEDESGNNVYSKRVILPSVGTSEMKINDSLFRKKTFKEKIKKPYLWIILILLFGLLGVGIGYVIHDIVNGDKHQSEQSEVPTVDNPEDETETGENIVEEEFNQEENQKETEAKEFLAQVDSCLNTKDLNFDYVENCYDQYMKDSALYASVDEEKVLSKLKAYNTVVEWIKQGGEQGYDSLNACAWKAYSNTYKNINPKLNKKHQDQLNSFFYGKDSQEREQRKECFLTHHESYKSFDKLKYNSDKVQVTNISGRRKRQ